MGSFFNTYISIIFAPGPQRCEATSKGAEPARRVDKYLDFYERSEIKSLVTWEELKLLLSNFTPQ